MISSFPSLPSEQQDSSRRVKNETVDSPKTAVPLDGRDMNPPAWILNRGTKWKDSKCAVKAGKTMRVEEGTCREGPRVWIDAKVVLKEHSLDMWHEGMSGLREVEESGEEE